MNTVLVVAVIVIMFTLLAFVYKLRAPSKKPFKGYKVLSVNGETALVDIGGYQIVAQNPFRYLCAGQMVMAREQGTGFSPYWVITRVL
jgi:hypothetical protein